MTTCTLYQDVHWIFGTMTPLMDSNVYPKNYTSSINQIIHNHQAATQFILGFQEVARYKWIAKISEARKSIVVIPHELANLLMQFKTRKKLP
jgi:hypothetical protein